MRFGDVVMVEDRSPKIETSTMFRDGFSIFDLVFLRLVEAHLDGHYENLQRSSTKG